MHFFIFLKLILHHIHNFNLSVGLVGILKPVKYSVGIFNRQDHISEPVTQSHTWLLWRLTALNILLFLWGRRELGLSICVLFTCCMSYKLDDNISLILKFVCQFLPQLFWRWSHSDIIWPSRSHSFYFSTVILYIQPCTQLFCSCWKNPPTRMIRQK